jgi:hypothetical protein
MRITYIAQKKPGHGRHTIVDKPLVFDEEASLDYSAHEKKSVTCSLGVLLPAKEIGLGCVMATTGKINSHPYDVHIVLSITEIRKLAENFLEQEDLVEIFKKKCGDVTLKELMK